VEIHEPCETPLPHAGEGIARGRTISARTNSVVAIARDGKLPQCMPQAGAPLYPRSWPITVGRRDGGRRSPPVTGRRKTQERCRR